jgi:hypothetical protein
MCYLIKINNKIKKKKKKKKRKEKKEGLLV